MLKLLMMHETRKLDYFETLCTPNSGNSQCDQLLYLIALFEEYELQKYKVMN